MAYEYIPEGYHSVTPYLVIKGASDALEYYRRAFGATEKLRMDGPEGMIMHAEMIIGNSVVMMADEMEGWSAPGKLGGSPVSLMIYVEDVDEVFARAIAAGGTELRPVEDQFYGDRTGTLKDPFGHTWTIATFKETLSPEELQRRLAEMMKDQG